MEVDLERYTRYQCHLCQKNCIRIRVIREIRGRKFYSRISLARSKTTTKDSWPRATPTT
jgi:hypothetical protein